MPELVNNWVRDGHPLACIDSVDLRISLGRHLPVKVHCKSVHEHALPILDIRQLPLDLALDELLEKVLENVQIILDIVRA